MDDYVEEPKKMSTLVWFIIVIVVIISIAISIIDIIIELIDTVADALSVGTIGFFTGIFDIISEIVLETIQVACISLVMILTSNSSWVVKSINFLILTACGVTNIALSLAGIFLPYFDVLELIISPFTEILQNFILGTVLDDFSFWGFLKEKIWGSADYEVIDGIEE